MRKQEQEQYHSARALIRNLCCNYDRPTGVCLLRGAKCPQLTSGSLICRYFRDVLLEDPSGKELKTAVNSEEYVKPCESCGKLFRAVRPDARRCCRCSAAAERRR